MRASKSQILIGLLVVIVALITTSFSARISINNVGGKVEFGQGIVHTVACDTYIPTVLTTKMDTATSVYYVDTLVLQDLSIRLRNRTLKVEILDKTGVQINQNTEFSVGSDGLTYTSTSTHVDNLEAFERGGGSNRETGTSTITFTGLLNKSGSRILAADVATVNLETSGVDDCTSPANIRAVEAYIEAPNVQGSYIAESFTAASLTDDYNSTTGWLVDCPTSGTTGTYSFGSCKILQRVNPTGNVWYQYGGAITSSSVPTTGGAATLQTASAAAYDSNGTTVTFATRKNYLGFWWSAGSYGNTIKFYRGSTVVATMTGDDVYAALPNNSTTLTALNGNTTYTASNYYGHPINTANPRQPREPFVYIHVFAVNGFNFDKVQFTTTGNGFEWDNLTVANLGTSQLTPKRTLVLNQTYNYSG